MNASNRVSVRHGERMEAGPTLDEVRTWPATVDLRRACAALGISQSWGYELARTDEFPAKVLTVRGRKRVITASLVSVLSGTAG